MAGSKWLWFLVVGSGVVSLVVSRQVVVGGGFYRVVVLGGP